MVSSAPGGRPSQKGAPPRWIAFGLLSPCHRRYLIAMTEPRADLLIVDDTPDNLRLLTDMLKQQGYKVRGARSGEMALRAAGSLPPDLVLLDINMPGMDGYEVCRRLKADDTTRGIPVVFLSALDEPLDKVRGRGRSHQSDTRRLSHRGDVTPKKRGPGRQCRPWKLGRRRPLCPAEGGVGARRHRGRSRRLGGRSSRGPGRTAGPRRYVRRSCPDPSGEPNQGGGQRAARRRCSRLRDLWLRLPPRRRALGDLSLVDFPRLCRSALHPLPPARPKDTSGPGVGRSVAGAGGCQLRHRRSRNRQVARRRPRRNTVRGQLLPCRQRQTSDLRRGSPAAVHFRP